jgi:hypothetical protein
VRILAAHEASVISLALEGIEQTVARKRDHLSRETPPKMPKRGPEAVRHSISRRGPRAEVVPGRAAMVYRVTEPGTHALSPDSRAYLRVQPRAHAVIAAVAPF